MRPQFNLKLKSIHDDVATDSLGIALTLTSCIENKDRLLPRLQHGFLMSKENVDLYNILSL